MLDQRDGQAEGSTKASDTTVDKQKPPARSDNGTRQETCPEAVGQYPVRGEQVEGGVSA